jgi:hypothetical protein
MRPHPIKACGSTPKIGHLGEFLHRRVVNQGDDGSKRLAQALPEP